MTYSFSRLNAFHTCKYMWSKQYLEEDEDKIDNGFALLGTITHEVLEAFYKKKLEGRLLSITWQSKYGDIEDKLRFPSRGMAKAYRLSVTSYLFALGKKYPSHYTGDYKLKGVERKIEIKLGEHDFVGYIDLELESPDGDLYIVDHKISRPFEKSQVKSKLRQLYLYSLDYETPPDYLMYNFFKANTTVRYKFDKEAQEEAKQWALDTIEMIEKEKDFNPNLNKFFCGNLCSYGHSCKFANKNSMNHKSKRESTKK